MEEVRKWYETVNDKCWNLKASMNTMSRGQTDSPCAIESKLDALMGNSINQDKAVSEKTGKQPGTRVDFAGPHRKKQESTPLPPIHHIIGSEPEKAATKGNGLNSTRIHEGIK